MLTLLNLHLNVQLDQEIIKIFTKILILQVDKFYQELHQVDPYSQLHQIHRLLCYFEELYSKLLHGQECLIQV